MPNLYIIAGGNGSGKTTIASKLLPDYFNCTEFVNADILASGMAPKDVASVAITAGKMTLELIDRLFDEQMSFALETTLSGKIHERIIKKAQRKGYYVVLIYVWVESYRISVSRVKSRSMLGGHFVPKHDVIRRYQRGLINLFNVYMELCDFWSIIDNTRPPQKLIASGAIEVDIEIFDTEIWKRINSTVKEYESRA